MHNAFTAGFSDELVKLSHLCSPFESPDNWSDRFKGTPLHEKALELEEQQAEGELQLEQRRAANAEQRQQEQQMYQMEDQTRTQFRIGRKQLELELARLQRGAMAGQREDGWQDLDFAGRQQQAAPPAAAAAPPPSATVGPGQ